MRALRSATSPKDHSRRAPSRASSTMAGRAGSAASTTSRAKFIARACPSAPRSLTVDRMREHRRRGTAIVVSCAALGLLAAPAQGAAPKLLEATFDKAPVTSRASTLTVEATGSRAVSGIVVAFADGLFGESACRTKARKRVSFAIPHVFSKAGPQPLAVRLDDGGCKGGGAALTQPYIVTPVNPGDPPAANPLVALAPIVTLPTAEGQAPAPARRCPPACRACRSPRSP